MKRYVLIPAMVLVAVLASAAECNIQGPSNPVPTADSSIPPTGFQVPNGAVAQPPVHGDGVDPRDDDFFNPAHPPANAPKGTATYEVRAQMYNADAHSIGGLATAFITATAADPRVVSGVGPGGAGQFPYNKESVRLPFQLPIFIQPGIVVSVGATFHAFAEKGEILSCWLMAPNIGEIPGTRHDNHATAAHELLTVDCYGNIGT